MAVGTIGTNFIRGRKLANSDAYAPAVAVRNFAREQSIIFQSPGTGAYSGGWDNVGRTTVGTQGTDWTTAVSSDKASITLNTLSATGRNFINETFPNPNSPYQPPIEVGKFYAFVCQVTEISGSVGTNNMQIATGGVGQTTAVIGYNVIRFQATATAVFCRIGVGSAAAAGAPGSMTLGKMWFTEIDSLTANVPDYVPPNSIAYMKYAAGNTVSGNVLTLAQGALLGNPPFGLNGGGMGDSISTDFFEWPGYLSQLKPGRSIRMMSQQGRTMQEMASMMPLFIGKDGQSASLADLSFFVVQAGINDLIQNRTAAQIEADLNTALNYLPTNCIKIVCAITPFGNHANWTSAREVERVAYNNAIAARTDVWFADISTPLEQQQYAVTLPDKPTLSRGSGQYANFDDQVLLPGTPGTLSTGDGLHPNAMAEMVIAATIHGVLELALASGAGSGWSRPSIKIAIGI